MSNKGPFRDSPFTRGMVRSDPKHPKWGKVDHEIRWGGQQLVQVALATNGVISNQLINIEGDIAEVYSLLLFAQCLDPVTAAFFSVDVAFVVNLGVGNASLPLGGNTSLADPSSLTGLKLRFDQTLAAPVETYQLLATPNQEAFKAFEFPCRQMQVVAQVSTNGGAPNVKRVLVGAIAAPRVNKR